MNPPSSSTSSSDGQASTRRSALKFIAWTIFFLTLLDLAVNLLFSYPTERRELQPNRLQLYFDYGRSMEGRLRRATHPNPNITAPITLAGWYHPLISGDRPDKGASHTITLYGNSQTVRLADALHKTSSTYAARTIAAPGSTANWAFGAYLRDDRDKQGIAAVLTIMPSNLPMIRSMSPMTWNTSFAMPYTADTFEIQGGQLLRHRPPYESFSEYTATLADSDKWREAKKTFLQRDPFYDPFLFEQSILDSSTIVRLIRRGWAQRRDAKVRADSLGRETFDHNDPAVQVANAIVGNFARHAEANGLIPVVHIVNSRGYGSTMFRSLERTLARERIPYMSTHHLIDPNDPRNYLPDSHFTDENDLRLARALEAVLNRELQRRDKRNRAAQQ